MEPDEELPFDVDKLARAIFREYIARHKYTKTKDAFDIDVPRSKDDLSSRAEMCQLLDIEAEFEAKKKKHGKDMPSCLEILSEKIIRNILKSEQDALIQEQRAEVEAKKKATAASVPVPVPASVPVPVAVPVTAGNATAGGPGAALQKKQLRREDFLCMRKRSETIMRRDGDIAGQQFVIDDVEDCRICLLDYSAQISVDFAKNCEIIIGPCEGSVFLRDCENCTFAIATRQFRCRDCVNCTVFLYCATEPIIETSTGLKFAPWNAAYKHQGVHFERAGLDPGASQWDRIFDFNKDQDVKGTLTHWAKLGTDDFKVFEFDYGENVVKGGITLDMINSAEDGLGVDEEDMDVGDLAEEENLPLPDNESKQSAVTLDVFFQNGNAQSVADADRARKDTNKNESEPAVAAVLEEDILEVEDIDEDDLDNSLPLPEDSGLRQQRRIDRFESHALKQLIFGPQSRLVPDAWTHQKLTEFVKPVGSIGNWAINQEEGGPCGILAAVQAFVLRELLFGSKRTQLTKVSAADARKALVSALAFILDQIRESSLSSSFHVVQGRGADFAAYSVFSFSSLKDVVDFLAAAPDIWALEFLLSMILTRGGPDVIKKEDFDDPGATLIGSHSYGTQELVNLVLFGRAHSQVFDGQDDSHGIMLRGCPIRSEIGFLTLLEYYQNVQVGSNLKNPKLPIWVICSESHYSVCWSHSAKSAEAVLEEDELWYYDGLARMTELVHWTVKANSTFDGESDSPLENVLRTRWTAAEVDWNGADRIL
eukprot:ANDGO_07355.mRNA.1 Protein FAM188A homolog